MHRTERRAGVHRTEGRDAQDREGTGAQDREGVRDAQDGEEGKGAQNREGLRDAQDREEGKSGHSDHLPPLQKPVSSPVSSRLV